jgi:hypothetical protein
LSQLHPGFGLPRADFLKAFKTTPKKYDDVLTDLVRDKYFQPKGDRAMGESASWGLILHLARDRKLNYLANYAKQLNEMPRHMALPPQTLEKGFKLSFYMDDVRDARRINPETWFKGLGDLPPESQDGQFFAPPTPAAAP